MPPFNLSCQVRIRCFYICGEWAVVVQLDCWGQLLCTAATLKPSWSSHAGFWSLVSRSADPFRLAFICSHSAAGIPGPEGRPSSFPSGFAGTAMHLPNPSLSLCSSLEWRKRQFFLASALLFLPHFTPVSSRKDVSLFFDIVQPVSCSQMDTCPLVI